MSQEEAECPPLSSKDPFYFSLVLSFTVGVTSMALPAQRQSEKQTIQAPKIQNLPRNFKPFPHSNNHVFLEA